MIRATLQSEKDAIGHNGVVVTQIRVAGAMDDVCTVHDVSQVYVNMSSSCEQARTKMDTYPWTGSNSTGQSLAIVNETIKNVYLAIRF